MNTRKEISTISYNTESFLRDRLEQLLQDHKISDFMYIKHHHEDDELKDHIHLWLKPNTQLDTMSIQDFMREFDPDNPTRPLKCIDFRSSQSDDWILYNLHDPEYLASKGESRRYQYFKEDICVSDQDTFEFNYYHAYHCSKWADQKRQLTDLFEFDKNKADLIRQGRVPLQMASQLLALQSLQRTYRGYHENHEMNEEYRKMFELENKAKK